MSPTQPPTPFHEEPSNSDLRELMVQHHETVNTRLSDLEYHLIDKKHPQKTLPIRVQNLEKFARVLKWAGGTVLGGSLAAAGSYLWERMKNGSPTP